MRSKKKEGELKGTNRMQTEEHRVQKELYQQTNPGSLVPLDNSKESLHHLFVEDQA